MSKIIEANYKYKNEKGVEVSGYAYINKDNISWFERGLVAGTTSVYLSGNFGLTVQVSIDEFRKLFNSVD